MNLLRQDQAPIELQNIFCFISSERNRIKKKSNSQANGVVYLENLVTLY